MDKICFIFNVAANYREPIFKVFDENLNCDFFIGDQVNTPIVNMDISKLVNLRRRLTNIYIYENYYWQLGILNTLFHNYKYFIITGDPRCLSTWAILLFLKLTKKKTYLWTHGFYGKENYIEKIVKKLFFSLSTGLLLYGDHARNLIIKNGIRHDKLHCVYNSLDYSLQVKIRNQLKVTRIFNEHFKNDYPVICYVGRIQKVKRIDLLIDAMVLLKKKLVFVNLVIIGSEIEETNLRDYVNRNDLSENVWFLGSIYDESRIGSVFFNSRICVSPGNVGLTAIHSLTYGCPVITHNNFANQMPEFEVIEKGVTGDFFEENDIYDLSFKIEDWIDKHNENDLSLKEKCYRIIDEKYNPDYQLKVIKSLL